MKTFYTRTWQILGVSRRCRSISLHQRSSGIRYLPSDPGSPRVPTHRHPSPRSFRCAIPDIIEKCHLQQRNSQSVRIRAQGFHRRGTGNARQIHTTQLRLPADRLAAEVPSGVLASAASPLSLPRPPRDFFPLN